MRPTKPELAYCAGLFDGEGCIILQRHDISKWTRGATFVRGRRIRFALFLQLKQVRPEPVQFMHAVLGGRLGFRPRSGKQSHYAGEWIWYSHSGGAARILRALRPYLRLKGEQADVAIRFQKGKLSMDSPRGFKLGITDEEYAAREAAFEELVRLKHCHNDPITQAEYRRAGAGGVTIPVRV